jgi:uncharacterized 2Fe-2S/4Fe-4S cluster protein (DUF4445 family)
MTSSTSKLKSFMIDMQPVGRRIEIEAGQNLLEASQAAGVGLVSLCGGEGWCESCKIRITSGEVNPPSESEKKCLGEEALKAGLRLACQTIPQTNLRIGIPPESLSTPQRLQVEGKNFDIPLAPIVKIVDLELRPPDPDDLRSDMERLKNALAENNFPGARMELPVLTSISESLRGNKWSVRIVIRENEVIAILPPESRIYGISVDIGTTKLAFYLVDLMSGEVVDKVGEMNPQIAYGEDVVSRIGYANQNRDGRKTLQRVLIEALNKKIQDLCEVSGIKSWQIVDAVVVGNTAIHHLFIGLPVRQLGHAPYIPAISDSIDIRAGEIGVGLAPGAYIHLLPNIAGYVGADHSAVILSTELWKTKKTVLVIDIGTNTEISLAVNGSLLSCSCASGPAFEGAHIANGMRAAPGAIEHIQIMDGEIKLFTIEDKLPVGICGSGILDVVAEMRKANWIDEKGAFIEGHLQVLMTEKSGFEFVLVPAVRTGHGRDITVSRRDVNEIQLAKAAIRAGLDTLLMKAGISVKDIDEVIIAGAFGTYINIPNAIKIGLFPAIPAERFRQVGNAAGMGAVQALLSVDYRMLIKEVIKKVDYLELTTYKSFQDAFLKAMYLR